MTAVSRRALLASATAFLVAFPAQGEDEGWVEVTGYARARGPDDIEAARRRALADALLAAALAGGAEVRGHSVLSKARLTSDLMVVRTTGRILAYRLVSAAFDGTGWTLRLRARVAGANAGNPAACAVRRKLTITALRPGITVRTTAPAWSGPVAAELAENLLRAVAAHRSVVRLTRLSRPLPGTTDVLGELYLARTQGVSAVPTGDHVLDIAIEVQGVTHGTELTLNLRLSGPMGEGWAARHRGTARDPQPSPLGRSAILVTPLRSSQADSLVRGAVDALAAMLDRAACREVSARLALVDGRLTAQVGSDHGLSQTSLAYTPEDVSGEGMLEVTELSRRHVVLRPLDPQRPANAFASRTVLFVLFGQPLP